MNVSTLSSWFRPAAAPQPLKADDVGPWPALAELGKVRPPAGYEPQDTATVGQATAPAGAGQASSPASQGSTSIAAQAGSTVPGPIGAVITPLIKQQLEGVVDRLAAKGIKFEARLTDGTFKQNLVGDESWRFDGVTPQGASVVMTDLDDLRVLDGVEGAPTLTRDEQSQAQALEALYGKGYKRECQQYGTPIHPASILNTLRDGYDVYLYPKDAANPHTCKTPDHLYALAFFEGVGPSEGLANPALAETLKQASDRGLKLHTQYLEIAPHQAYRESRGPLTEMLVSKGTVPVKTTEAALSNLDALDAHLTRLDAAFGKYASPVLARHGLSFHKDYFPKIATSDDSIPVDVRVAVGAALIDKYKQAIPAQGIFTREVGNLYGAIRERAADTGELVRMTARVMSRIDKMPAAQLLELAQTSPSLSKVSTSDSARTSHLETLLAETGSIGALLPCLDALDGPRESLDARAQDMLTLLRHLPPQERELVAEHYKAMKDMEGDTQEARLEAYLTEIVTQQLRGARQDVTWEVTPPAPKPTTPPATVEVAGDYVMVGGLKVPRRS